MDPELTLDNNGLCLKDMFSSSSHFKERENHRNLAGINHWLP